MSRRTSSPRFLRAVLKTLTPALVLSFAAAGLGATPALAAPAVTAVPTVPTAVTAVDDSDASPVQRLGACLAGGGIGDVVLLVDESESVRTSDPQDARATSAAYFVDKLGSYASQNSATVSVQVATFAQTYTPITGWIGLDAAGLTSVQESVDSVAERDSGWETDYWSALNGARTALAEAAAARADQTSCQAIVWLSDGELSFSANPKDTTPKGFAPDLVIRGDAAANEAKSLAQQDLCRPGGLADQLRSSGVITFGIGLDGKEVPAGGFDLMESIVAGGTASGSTTCGSILEPVPGAFYLASDIDSLLFAFDELSTPGQPPIKQEHGICQVAVCAGEGHRVVLDASTPRVTILASSDLPGAVVSIQAPSGEIVEVPTGSGETTIAGATLTYAWESDRSLSVVLDEAEATQWRGLWQLAFTDPAGTSAGQTSKSHIRVQGALLPDWPGAEDVELHAGQTLDDITLGFRTRDGQPADSSIIEGSLEYSAIFRDSAGETVTMIRATDPAELDQPVGLDLSDAALGAGIVTLQSRITTAPTTFEGEDIPGTQLEAETVTVPVTVLPPLEYPVVGTAVDFGHLEADDVRMSAVLPVSGSGCVRLPGETEVLASPEDIGAVAVSTDDSGCVEAGADGVAVTLTAENSGNGSINGTFVVELEPKGGGEALETTVSFTASLARPVNAVNFWLTLLVALLLGPGLPLGILYLMKRVVSTIPAKMLYGFVVDVTIDDTGVRRDGQPFAVRPSDTAKLVSVPPNARSLTIEGIGLRVRNGLSPFGRGHVVVEAEGQSSISSATPSTDRTRRTAVLPLAIHNHWVLLRTPGAPADRARLLALLGGNDQTTVSRFVQTLADRAPNRLAGLVATETAAGAAPATAAATDPFAGPAPTWQGGNPFDTAGTAPGAPFGAAPASPFGGPPAPLPPGLAPSAPAAPAAPAPQAPAPSAPAPAAPAPTGADFWAAPPANPAPANPAPAAPQNPAPAAPQNPALAAPQNPAPPAPANPVPPAYPTPQAPPAEAAPATDAAAPVDGPKNDEPGKEWKPWG